MTVSLDCDGTPVAPSFFDLISVVDGRVRLNLSIDEAKRLWATEPYAKRHDRHSPKWRPETTAAWFL